MTTVAQTQTTMSMFARAASDEAFKNPKTKQRHASHEQKPVEVDTVPDATGFSGPPVLDEPGYGWGV